MKSKYIKMSKEKIKKLFDSVPKKMVLEPVEFFDVSVSLYPPDGEWIPRDEEAGLRLEFGFSRKDAIKLFDWQAKIFDITKDSKIRLTFELIDEPTENKYEEELEEAGEEGLEDGT
jgi:hypothetical protein